jgi:hypothetical protein
MKEKSGMRAEPEPEIELEPDAWERFERAVDIVAKSPPQPRTAKPRLGKPASKPKGAKGKAR